jgi:hypothetical protein
MALKLGAVVAPIQADISNFQRGIKEAGKGMGAFGKNVTSRLKSIQSGMDRASKKIGDAGKVLSTRITAPVVAAATAVGAAMVKYGNYADSLLDLAAITGLSTDAMQKWRKVAVDAGVDLNLVASNVQTFNKQLERGNELSPRLAKAFDTMNISLEDFRKLNVDERMKKIVSTMLDLNELDRIAFANQMNMADMLPMIAEMESSGKSLDEILDGIDVPFSEDDLNTMNEFRKSWDNLKETIFKLVGQALKPLFEWFAKNEEMITQKVQKGVEQLGGQIQILIGWWRGLSEGVRLNILRFAGFMVVLGPALVLIAGLIKVVSGVIGVALFMVRAFQSVIGIVKAVIGVVKLLTIAKMILFAKVILVIAIVYGLVRAIQWLISNWHHLRSAAGVVFNFLVGQARQFLGVMMGVIGGIVGQLWGFVSNMWNVAGNIFNALINPFVRAKDFIANLFRGFNPLSGVSNAVSSIRSRFGFASGVRAFGGGMATINERGPELVGLPNGSTVIPASLSSEMLSGLTPATAGVTIGNITINNEADSDRFFRELDRRTRDESIIG